MSRIIERIYENLKKKKLSNLTKIGEDTNISGATSNKNNRINKKIPELKSILSRNKFKISKTLIISGSVFNRIQESQELSDHLRFIVLFCKNIVAYNLEPIQKLELMTFLKNQKSSKIMAVGDGFNDAAMIKKADIGI